MRILQAVAVCVLATALAVLARADEPKKSDKPSKAGKKDAKPANKDKEKTSDEEKEPDYAKLLVGKWEGVGKFKGITMEYTADGKHRSTVVLNPGAKPTVVNGSWKIKGDQLTHTLFSPAGSATDTVVITKLTDKEFQFKNRGGVETTYEKPSETGPEPPSKNKK